METCTPKQIVDNGRLRRKTYLPTLPLEDMVTRMAGRQEKTVLVWKITPEGNFYILFPANRTSGLFNFSVTFDLGFS